MGSPPCAIFRYPDDLRNIVQQCARSSLMYTDQRLEILRMMRRKFARRGKGKRRPWKSPGKSLNDALETRNLPSAADPCRSQQRNTWPTLPLTDRQIYEEHSPT